MVASASGLSLEAVLGAIRYSDETLIRLRCVTIATHPRKTQQKHVENAKVRPILLCDLFSPWRNFVFCRFLEDIPPRGDQSEWVMPRCSHWTSEMRYAHTRHFVMCTALFPECSWLGDTAMCGEALPHQWSFEMEACLCGKIGDIELLSSEARWAVIRMLLNS